MLFAGHKMENLLHKKDSVFAKENYNRRLSSVSVSAFSKMPPERVTSTETLYYSGEAVVLVTPYSTGCCIAQEISRRGYHIICLWNKSFSEEMKKHVPSSCSDLKYYAEITEEATLAETIVAVQKAAGNFKIVACMCGGEAGVDLADALSEALGFLTNGTDIPNRRDKKVQQELVKAAGFRSVRQAGGKSFSDVQAFLKAETYPVILKPVDSAGSDGVKLCHSYEEAKEYFHYLMEDHHMVNGGTCSEVLCQEFLQGKEYVVDHVSRDGVHKTVMVWEYDKRLANGSPFVYFGVVPMDSESPQAKLMIPYVRGVLGVLGVKNGPSHGEVIMTVDGPCLVEMNCRAHGGDGNWQPLCRALTGGYTQVDASVDCYLDKERFFRLPDKPPSPFKASGQEVDLVSFTVGTVKATPGFELIKKLTSFRNLETHIKPGSKVSRTVDLVTDIANIILMHPDKVVLKRDVEFIRKLETEDAIFEYKEAIPEACIDLNFMLNKKTHRRRLTSEDPPEMYW